MIVYGPNGRNGQTVPIPAVVATEHPSERNCKKNLITALSAMEMIQKLKNATALPAQVGNILETTIRHCKPSFLQTSILGML